MKKGRGAAAILLLIAAGGYLFLNPKARSPLTPAPATQKSYASLTKSSSAASTVATPPAASNSPAVIAPPIQASPRGPAAQAGELVPDQGRLAQVGPETALQNVQRAVRQYGEMFGGNPVGTNPEITSQLSGNNPKHINFITPQPGTSINGDGELVDAWGTPYFFHQISGSEMEIHSAGPDKIMWTADDLVVK
jgi:hypothetical protein